MEFSVSDLSCRRGETVILKGVSLRVASGRALILRGPNGSGKTTLLRTLAGLTPAPEGQLSFEPDDVAYAGHADGLKSQLTVQENLRFWADIYGTADINPAIEAFDLEALLDRRTQDLSAGQKRRLSLARLVLTRAKLWALDEPTVSLDTDTVAKFARAVETHLASGGAAIIATHIDLGLNGAEEFDVSPFRALGDTQHDPFADDLADGTAL